MQSTVEKSHEVTKEQGGEVDIVPTDVDIDSQPKVVDPEPLLPEDLALESDAKVDVTSPKESGDACATSIPDEGPLKVPSGEPVASTDWNNAPANGGISGWTSAEPPAGLENGVTHGDSAASPESGVLGSGPSASKPAEKPALQVYNFYMVKVPRPEDKQGKTEILSAEQQLQDKTDARKVQNSTVQAAKVKRNEAIEKRRAARQVERDCLALVRKKFEEIRPLRDNLKRLKGAAQGMSRNTPTTEEELDHRIAALEWRIQHESIPLKEEKQLIRDIKQLQSSRESVRANAPRFAQVHEGLGQRDELEAALKPLETEYKSLELELKTATRLRDLTDKEFTETNDALDSVLDNLKSAHDKMHQAYVHRKSLKDQEYFRMSDHYDNKRQIQEAKMLANQPNNRKAVEEYCNAQVERMLELWNTDPEYRVKYIKDNEWSTARRLFSSDGRSLGPDEARPIVFNHTDGPHSTGPASQQNGSRAGGNVKQAVPARAEKAEAAVNKEVVSPPISVVEEKPTVKREPAKLPTSSPPVVEEAKSKEELEQEAAELKEQRRTTEMAKAKEAEERKRRIAERSQAKAQAWQQKEAERKEKEKEKKARKKASAVAPTESSSLADTAPPAETNESVVDTQEPVLEEVKVSSRQRKRGVTNSQKQAARVARASAPLPPVRVKQQKILGLTLPVLLGAGFGLAILAVVFAFLFSRGSVWSSAAGAGAGDFEEGSRFKARPEASSQSFK